MSEPREARFAPGTVHAGWRVTGTPAAGAFPRWPVQAEEGDERGELTFLPFAGPRASERRQLADRAAKAQDVGGETLARVVLQRSSEGLLVVVPEGGASAPERVDPREALEALRGVAEGLARLHAHGIVHGQVEPRSLVRQGGTLRLLPPGLFEGSEDLARLGVEGDPRWAAPEVLDGRKATPASDCFSLGLVLFTLLTGKPPVEATADGAALVLRATAPVPDLAAARPGLSAGLLSLWARLTAPRQVRIREGGELLEELERCEKRTLPAPTPSRPRIDAQRVGAPVIAALIAGGALMVAWTVAAVTTPGSATEGFAFPLPKPAEQSPPR